MDLTAALANSLWTASNLPALIRFRRALERPAETQLSLLRRRLAQNADSAYGRAHHFSTIRTYGEFARRVPLTAYDELEPWIARILRGETHVLTMEPVTHLIPTSGSTCARKLIPFTRGLQRQFHAALGPWLADLVRAVPSLALGPAYWSITPVIQSQATVRSAVPVGFEEDASYLGGARKWLVGATMAAPSGLRFVQDLEAFRYATLLCLLRRRDLRLISVWHPSFLALLLDALPDWWDALLGDVRFGTCSVARRLPLSIEAKLQREPQRRRAKELESANPQMPETLWPFLRVISGWGDGPATVAATHLARRFPGTHFQAKGLLATEAVVTIPFAGMWPLAIRSHFFEFIDPQGRVYPANRLHEGQTYEVVVTTAGGLWRYRLGDCVQVTGFVPEHVWSVLGSARRGGALGNTNEARLGARTPLLRFLGRAGNVSDLFGEKLSEGFVAQTIQAVVAASAATVRFALLAPDDDASGSRYTMYVEGDAQTQWAGQLDDLLRANPHYDWCRRLGQLQAPRVFRINARGFVCFVARETARGLRLGDVKPSLLSRRTGWSSCFDGDYVQSESAPARVRRAPAPAVL